MVMSSAKLLGSPPGYVGFDIEPLLSQPGDVRSLAGQLFPVSDDQLLVRDSLR